MQINYMKIKLYGMAGFLLSIAGSCALLQSAQAQFTDNNRDLILTFRQTGFDGKGNSSTHDFEVDLGQASIYYGAAWGSSIPITAYTTTQLSTLFNNFNDLSWSVGGCVDADGDGGSAAKPDGTLWLTDPRANPGTPSAAWVCRDIYSQANGCQGIETIMDNDGVDSQLYHSTALVDTSTALSITANTTWAPDSALGALGNYNGGFSGVVENTTPHTFATAGSPSRSDFYELQPSASLIGGPGTYLGYFELKTNGSLTFYAQYTQPTLSITSDGVNVYISFSTTPGGIYKLYYTSVDNMTAPVSSWTAVSPTITGNGSVQTFTQAIDPTGDGNVFGVGVSNP
jgi:hypothetical protein